MNGKPVESKQSNFWKGSASIVAGIAGMGTGEMARQMVSDYHVPLVRVVFLVVFALACGAVLGHHHAIQTSISEGESLD